MDSISISRAKTFKNCQLLYKYQYVDKFEPAGEKKAITVIDKGLILHETFEKLLKMENYDGEEPKLPFNKVSDEEALKILRKEADDKKLPDAEFEEYKLDLGLKRWLSFKHDFLDKNNHIMYAEKRYDEYLFGKTKTITILDLLEDCGDGNYIIYDYKTPKSVDMKRYKDQLALYCYTMAVVKKIIPLGSDDYQKVADHFKLFVFFPLIDGDHTTYEKSLKECSFTANDIKKTLEELKSTCATIDAFNFDRPAEVLQLCNPAFSCKWCQFQGSKPQKEIGFEGCPITCFCGVPPLNESFKRKE